MKRYVFVCQWYTDSQDVDLYLSDSQQAVGGVVEHCRPVEVGPLTEKMLGAFFQRLLGVSVIS